MRPSLRGSCSGGELFTGAYLRVEAGREAPVLSALARAPQVAGASSRRAGLDAFRRLMADSMQITRVVLWLFASVLAAGVVYNDGRVALAEQSRELATLRVLGFTQAECARLLLGGLGARVVASLVPGWGLGWLFARLLMAQLSNSEPVPVAPGDAPVHLGHGLAGGAGGLGGDGGVAFAGGVAAGPGGRAEGAGVVACVCPSVSRPEGPKLLHSAPACPRRWGAAR